MIHPKGPLRNPPCGSAGMIQSRATPTSVGWYLESPMPKLGGSFQIQPLEAK
jgi:hypothetical protein